MRGLCCATALLLVVGAACVQPFDELKPPCGESLAISRFGIQVREDSAWGLHVRDREADEGIEGVDLVVKLPGGEPYEVTTDSFGWVDWPEPFTEQDTVDIEVKDPRYQQLAWLGVPIGCVAIAPTEIREGTRVAVGLAELKWKTVTFEVDVSRLGPAQYTVHVTAGFPRGEDLNIFDVPPGADRVLVQVQMPLIKSLAVEVLVTLTSASETDGSWSGVKGWAGRGVRLSLDAVNGRLDPFVATEVRQEAVTVTFPPGHLPNDLNGAGFAGVSLRRDDISFGGAYVEVVADSRSLALAAPVLEDANLDGLEVVITGNADDGAFRFARTRSLGTDRFEAYPLLPFRHPVRDADDLVLGARSEQAHLTQLSSAGVGVVVFDNRSRIHLNDALINAINEGAQEVFVQDVRFVEPVSLSEPEVNNFTRTSYSLTSWRP